jgi:peptidoglycan hydrolase-like protein with peptidoglycan-binding domain
MPVSEMQAALNSLGFDAGSADGLAGPRTRAAIRAFEKDHGMEESGVVSLGLSMALRKTISEQAGGARADEPFDATTDAFIGELYDWRAVSATRLAAGLPEWLEDGLSGSDIAGPQSAWASTRLRGCRNVLACLDAYGAPAQALRAAYALEKSGLIGTYVSSFTEYGKVDLVSVGYPYNTGGLVEYALVNGDPQAVAMRAGDVLKVSVDDPGFARVRAEHPNAAIQFAPRFEAYRLMPDGGQRFVFSYPVTVGCQLCDAVGQVLMANDFAPDGTYRGLTALAYTAADAELARQVRRSFDAGELTSDVALLQRRLNGLGYAAGPVDGVSGQLTVSAVGEFQADHGLTETGEIDRETAELLASDGSVRHLQRLETLLLKDAPGADSFGLGLLSRFRQLPGNDQLQFAALANNMAGQLRRAGRFDEALEQLRQAEAAVNLAPTAQFDLYEAILLNSAAVHIDRGQPASAEETLRRATDVLRSRIPDFPLPDLSEETRPGLAVVENRRRATAGLAALSAYLTERATEGAPGTIRLKPMPVTDGDGAHLFTFQPFGLHPARPDRT